MIALGLFCRDVDRQIFRWLRRFRPGGIPGRSTWCEARQRLGAGPLRALAAQVAALLGRPETPGAFDHDLRTMAVDGFVLNVADTPANARAFGRSGSGRAPGAFPQVRVLALCETGSHFMWMWLIKCADSRNRAAALPNRRAQTIPHFDPDIERTEAPWTARIR